MSELKVYALPLKTNIFGRTIVAQSYYLKSEADKVIADLKEKHKTEVKELLCLIRNKENNFNRAFDSEEKEIRHQKYKRRLAMADRWLFAFYATNKCNDEFYLRNLKLRELAKKFKEAK